MKAEITVTLLQTKKANDRQQPPAASRDAGVPDPRSSLQDYRQSICCLNHLWHLVMAAKANQDSKRKPAVESGHGENLASHFSLRYSVYLSGKWEAWPRAVGFKLGFNPGIKS